MYFLCNQSLAFMSLRRDFQSSQRNWLAIFLDRPIAAQCRRIPEENQTRVQMYFTLRLIHLSSLKQKRIQGCGALSHLFFAPNEIFKSAPSSFEPPPLHPPRLHFFLFKGLNFFFSIRYCTCQCDFMYYFFQIYCT